MIQAQRAAAANTFAASRSRFEELCRRLETGEVLALEHHAVEELLRSEGQELLRQMFQDHLDLRSVHEQAAPLPAVVGEDGVSRRHVRDDTTRSLRSLLGPVQVRRLGYEERGVTSRFPMDAALNLPSDSYSLGVRYLVALTVASSAYDETVEVMQVHDGVSVPKRQAEELARRAATDFDAFYAQRDAPESTALSSLLILTTDAKGIIVRKEDLRPATRKAAAASTHKLKTRLSKGEKKYRKRMATVASVYTVAPYVRDADRVLAEVMRNGPSERPPRPKPEHKRVWASVSKEPVEVIREMFDEAERRDPRREKTWAVLVDGDPKQLRLIRREATARGVKVSIVLDFIHVLQYLWKASTAFHLDDAPEREAWVLERLRQVLLGKAVDVAAGIRRSATRRDLGAQKRKPVDQCANYLLKYKAHLRYDQYLAAGLPIASGVIEGACRHLVKDRMDLGGAHWGLPGAEAVLRLRALKSSDDFAAYWTFHQEQEYRRNHEAYYRGAVPRPHRPAAPPKLRLVP